MFAPMFDAETFESLLRKLLRHRKRSGKTVIILDNARYHHGISLRSLLERCKKVLRLDYLPPYSPELNPIERVWKPVRKNSTHKQYLVYLHDLLQAIEMEIARWEKPNRVLQKLSGII